MAKLEKNWLEWTVFGASLVLVIATICSLSYWTAINQNRPPEISIQLGSAEQRGEQYYLPVSLYNNSDTTAETVQVQVVVRKGDQQEEGAFELDFLPYRSRRNGEAVFTIDPKTADRVEARVLGYRKS